MDDLHGPVTVPERQEHGYRFAALENAELVAAGPPAHNAAVLSIEPGEGLRLLEAGEAAIGCGREDPVFDCPDVAGLFGPQTLRAGNSRLGLVPEIDCELRTGRERRIAPQVRERSTDALCQVTTHEAQPYGLAGKSVVRLTHGIRADVLRPGERLCHGRESADALT